MVLAPFWFVSIYGMGFKLLKVIKNNELIVCFPTNSMLISKRGMKTKGK